MYQKARALYDMNLPASKTATSRIPDAHACWLVIFRVVEKRWAHKYSRNLQACLPVFATLKNQVGVSLCR